ncbi:hypothetical protein HID58_086410 [Brassica napus]|uniref:Uncharacterized protein n=1 Tax=Brassica napus TaxID=3708 RepID=A0ABQ7XRQ6_BRANA|nr:hypothetical protein HID58_086410 [Brassica napus]
MRQREMRDCKGRRQRPAGVRRLCHRLSSSPSTCLYSSSLCSSGICTPPENAPLSSAAESETNTRLTLNLLSCMLLRFSLSLSPSIQFH